MTRFANVIEEKKGDMEQKVDSIYEETRDLLNESVSETLKELEPSNEDEDINVPSYLDELDSLGSDNQIEEDSEGLSLPEDFFTELEEMDKKIIFTVSLSLDRMSAYISAEGYSSEEEADNSVPTSDIYDLLDERKIIYGIDDAGIAEYCKGTSYYQDFVVAQGLAPINGEDGFVEYFFSTDETYQPKELADGTVDYKDLGIIKNVEADDVLCKITLPTEGTPGINILGEPVAPTPGNRSQIKPGKNVKLSEDELQFIATVNGMVQKTKDTIEVKEIYTVYGDVGISTGNIRFNGSVNIMGSVMSNFSVYANGDITVNGFVEGSFLNAAGNIVIHKGINGIDSNGMRKGFIKADGDVTVKFSEMAKIVAGGCVYSDYCMNSDVRAGDSIIGKGSRSSLLGGNYIAGKIIEANTIGSEINIPMDVQIIPNWKEMKNLETDPAERIKANNIILSDLEKSMAKLRKLFEMLESEMVTASKRRNMDDPSDIELKKEKLKKLMVQHETVKHELESLQAEKDKLEKINDCEGCMIITRKIIHTGTRITIGNAMLRINGHMELQTFTENNRTIEAHNFVPGR